MNKQEIAKAIIIKKIPSDDLDSFLDNFLGNLFQIMLILLFGYILLFEEFSQKSASKKTIFILFLVSFIWLAYGIYKKLTEKKLKSIYTNLSFNRNQKLIKEIIDEKKLNLITSGNGYYRIHISSWMNKGCRLIVLVDENVIYYNLRFVGSSRGRPPYSLGFVPYHRHKFMRAINDKLALIKR